MIAGGNNVEAGRPSMAKTTSRASAEADTITADKVIVYR